MPLDITSRTPNSLKENETYRSKHDVIKVSGGYPVIHLSNYCYDVDLYGKAARDLYDLIIQDTGFTKPPPQNRCSFCGKWHYETTVLQSDPLKQLGPTVYICIECVERNYRVHVLKEERPEPDAETLAEIEMLRSDQRQILVNVLKQHPALSHKTALRDLKEAGL
jgi:hypothetical protein